MLGYYEVTGKGREYIVRGKISDDLGSLFTTMVLKAMEERHRDRQSFLECIPVETLESLESEGLVRWREED